ncbi:hypothetical protein BD410DRAFT_382753 [Rickenella mellea]|uniref:F-box domain-containing protein n=1 Tax=Rickenella mellea TaxID=50990 RepID=A0A4Y7PXL3_9AGAM|nr:hypothetical protein BD410DRAFT_382753 [Rickenella mellea]
MTETYVEPSSLDGKPTRRPAQLPVEIWCDIFATTTYLPVPLDSPIDSFTYFLADKGACDREIALSTSTKLSLLLVSKRFYALSVEYFFRHIVIRHYRHLLCLSEKLRGSVTLAAHVSNWTRGLDICFAHPHREHEEMKCRAALVVLQDNAPPSSLILNACRNSSRTLKTVHWGLGRPVGMHEVVSTFPSLQALRVCRVSYYRDPSFTASGLMDHIHTLHGGLMRICGWFRDVSLPSLKVVELELDDYFFANSYNHDDEEPANIAEFFTTHGNTIRKLVVRGVFGFIMKSIGRCQNPQYLIFDIDDIVALRTVHVPSVKFPGVKGIGITLQNSSARVDHDKIFPQLLRSCFPALRVIRMMDRLMFHPEDEIIWSDWEKGMAECGIRFEDLDGSKVFQERQ